MRFRASALAVIVILACAAPGAASTAKPGAAMMKPVQMLLDALNAQHPSATARAFTANATIVDEFAPYRWSGVGASTAYLASLSGVEKAEKIAALHITLAQPTAFNHSGTRAYVVLPGTITVTASGKHAVEQGTFTFTLLQSGNAWQIDTATWATTSGG